ncbi:hypothetical protein BV898_13453 [Hypsibius exemplaris]|uniref:Uncharacterized protein n=1 Tax=Hypsibius exemplaris TaxID=2072580 RepID=A0A1W0WAM5_HYPEX|nr:hypothetical protein BV898_13453 [Hypsibius exemplaris]
MSLADTASNSLDENLAPDSNVMGFYESIMIYAQEVTLDDEERTELSQWLDDGGTNFRNGIGITGSLSIGKTNERDRYLDMKTFDAKLGEYNPDPVVMSFYESIMIYAQEVASMTEPTGEPMKIQITVATKDLLTNIGGQARSRHS